MRDRDREIVVVAERREFQDEQASRTDAGDAAARCVVCQLECPSVSFFFIDDFMF